MRATIILIYYGVNGPSHLSIANLVKFKGRRNEKLGSIEKCGDKGHFRRTKMGSICVAQICLHKRQKGGIRKDRFFDHF